MSAPAMQPQQQQSQKQQLRLSEQMLFSLQLLRLPLPELCTLIDQQALENPMLDADYDTGADSLFGVLSPATPNTAQTHYDEDGDEQYYPAAGWAEPPDLGTKGTLPEYLLEQLLDLRLDAKTEALCKYIVYCLNGRGYLEFTAEELAGETGTSPFAVTQAIYTIQELEPRGVAAQSLTECLLLQLAAGPDFSAHTVRAARSGLTLIAQNDMKALAALLGCDVAAAKQAAQVVRGLNPIPARGFRPAEDIRHVVPDAAVLYEAGACSIELNRAALPRLRLDATYAQMLNTLAEPAAAAYLKEKAASATKLIKALDERCTTLHRILACMVELQPGFFATGSSLRPMTLTDVATRLGIHVSTVSRAVNEKYIVCAAGTVHLKDLFQKGLAGSGGEDISAGTVLSMIKKCVENESPAKPLSDQKICETLQDMDIEISRRTVAKYRDSLGIPSAAKRRWK